MRYGHLLGIILLLLGAAVFGMLVITSPGGPRIGVTPRPVNNPAATSSVGLFYTEAQSEQVKNVVYTASGFSPVALRVQAGTTVVFQNRSPGPFSPASYATPE